MAVVMGTVVAGAAGSATAGATTTGSAVTSAAATAKQADSIRQLALAFVKAAGMKAVGDSEIVDEFASPIYAGLAAIPMGPAPTTPGMPVAKAGGSMPELVAVPTPPIPGTPVTNVDERQLKDLIATNGEATVEEKINQNGSEHSNKPSLSPDATANRPVLKVEKPEIKELIDQYYDAPTIKDQLDAGSDKIVVERKVLKENVSVSGDKCTATCLIEERVIDRKYLEHGNLTDLLAEVRHGHVPTIHQLYLAIIDLTDLATLKVFRPLLVRAKIEPAKYRLRQLTADFETKMLEPTLGREEKSEVKLDRKVEERSWYKTDHVTEKIGHKDTVSQKQLEIAAVNITDLCTVELNKGSIDGYLSRDSELADLSADSDSIVRIEKSLPSEAIASINKSAMAWVRENLCSTTSEYTTVETFNRYKADLDGFLGKKIEMSDKQVTERVKTTYTEYLSSSDRINLEDIDSYQQACEKFASLQKTMVREFDPVIVDQYVELGEGVTFDDGWITYIPGGSIANLGVKVDLDAKITGMDVFWAAVDVATIAIAIATWGTSTAVTSAGVAVGKAVAKGGAKVIVKSGSKVVVKESAKAVSKTIAARSGEIIGKQTAKISINNAGRKAGVKVGAQVANTTGVASEKRVVASTSKVVVGQSERNSGVRAAKTIADDSAKVSEKTVVKKDVETVVKVSTRTGLEPNATYEKSGFVYTTDSQGRVIKATGKLRNSPGVRNPANQTAAKNMGLKGDQGGHLIPARYGGPGDLMNHVPQAQKVNQSTVKCIENEMGRAVKQGKDVQYTIMPHYPPGSETLRPDKFTIRYTIDGVTKIRRITNG